MDLIIPEFGLIIWQLITFGIVFFLLAKFAWKPILKGLKEREDSIDESLKSADKAREDMEKLSADNEKLLDEAKMERDKMLLAAEKTAKEIIEATKGETKTVADKMIEEAKLSINAEKNAAMADIKGQVADLTILIAEKLLRENLKGDKEQEALVAKFIKELNLN